MECLKAGLKGPLEMAIRTAVGRDQRAQRRLAAMAGRHIEVRLQVPPMTLVLSPHGEGIDLADTDQAQGDCVIEGSSADLLQLLLDEHKAFGAGVRISGDSQLAIDFKRALQDLDLDWEGFLGDHLGDLVAHPLAEFLREGRALGRRSLNTLLDDMDNYLHEELRALPPREELNGFYGEVDSLRLAVDRLQARVKRLQSAVESTDPGQ